MDGYASEQKPEYCTGSLRRYGAVLYSTVQYTGCCVLYGAMFLTYSYGTWVAPDAIEVHGCPAESMGHRILKVARLLFDSSRVLKVLASIVLYARDAPGEGAMCRDLDGRSSRAILRLFEHPCSSDSPTLTPVRRSQTSGREKEERG